METTFNNISISGVVCVILKCAQNQILPLHFVLLDKVQ